MGAGAAASLVFLLMAEAFVNDYEKEFAFYSILSYAYSSIGISIYNKDIERIERAFYFLLSICGAILCLP